MEKAVLELGIQAEVMMVPALYVDGEAKAVGRAPSVEEIKKLLRK